MVESSGLPRVREKSGKFEFFQGQGIVREFCKLCQGNLEFMVKSGSCQGILIILDSSSVTE